MLTVPTMNIEKNCNHTENETEMNHTWAWRSNVKGRSLSEKRLH